MTEQRSLHLLGALGAVRTEMVGNKEHLVVPVVALMEGVIHAVNAETPEFVPFETLRKAAESWNGRPVTLGHPKRNGKQCSAQDPGILAAHGIGIIRNAHVEGKKLLCEALIESARAKRLHPDMYTRLAEGGTEEVSVGAMVVTDKTAGKFNGKSFLASWTSADGDHLAFLPGGRGACSVAMGCGTHRAAMRVCGDHLEDIVEKTIIDSDTLRCLRNIPQAERDKMPESDFAGPDQSFPIKTQADVDAAAHLVGKAASPEVVKKQIMAIAKHKGLKIPNAWTMGMKNAAAGDDAEEQAELIAYQSMRTVLDGVAGQYEEISKLVDALIADETESPSETDEEEVAEEQVETARLDAIRTMSQSLSAALNAVISATYCQSLSDTPRYMAALSGARHNVADTKVIQAVHDHSMSLGAVCDRSNYKQLEGKMEDGDPKLRVANMNDARTKMDPNRHYIESVRQRAAR